VKEAKDGPRGPQGIPIGAKVCNEDAKRSLMASQRNAKHPPGTQKGSSEDPKSATKTPKGAPGHPRGTQSTPPGTQKGSSEDTYRTSRSTCECRCPYRALGLRPLPPPLASFWIRYVFPCPSPLRSLRDKGGREMSYLLSRFHLLLPIISHLTRRLVLQAWCLAGWLARRFSHLRL